MSDKDKLELSKKIGLFGLSDLRKLAPIGDLGYANGWMHGGIENAIVKAFWEQQKIYGWEVKGYSSGYRQTDHHTYCKELGLSWSVDSGD